MAVMSLGSLAELVGVQSTDGAAARDSVSGRSFLLVMRFGVLNTALLALVAAAWLQGWLDAMIATDTYHVVKIIALVFLAGMQQCAARVAQLSGELNGLARGFPAPGSRAAAYLALVRDAEAGSRGLHAGNLRLKLATRLGNVRYIANLLVLLGLIGTVLGFIVALSGISPSTVSDVNAIGPMVSSLLSGMAIALYTTLAGSLLNIWLMLNYRLLEHGTVQFYTHVVELGERR
jgi:hypothetical protein